MKNGSHMRAIFQESLRKGIDYEVSVVCSVLEYHRMGFNKAWMPTENEKRMQKVPLTRRDSLHLFRDLHKLASELILEL